MERSVLLGVDGGGTKTDLFLFDTHGKRLGHLREVGSCIDLSQPDRYGYTKKVLGSWIDRLCAQAGVERREISSAVFGLAGIDIREEHDKTLQVIGELLHAKIEVCNDSMMGVLAAAPKGVGVACACGTWTATSGRNRKGEILQVSGIGPISTESAGGYFLALEALRYVYSARYRDGVPTVLTRGVLDILHLEPSADLHEQFHQNNLRLSKEQILQLSKLVFQSAKEEDAVAKEILCTMAHTLAENTAGCIKNLNFEEQVTIVLSGSIWVKTDYLPLKKIYMQEVQKRVSCACDFLLLQEAPALGAVLQAYRIATGKDVPEDIRLKISAATII